MEFVVLLVFVVVDAFVKCVVFVLVLELVDVVEFVVVVTKQRKLSLSVTSFPSQSMKRPGGSSFPIT